MASNIPVIVQGNSFSLAIPLQIYYINGDQMDLQDYTPDPTDEVSVQLKGSRRNYTYTPTIDGNVANIDLSGNELADNYSVVVSIVKANGQRLRSFRTDQFFIVESSDDLTTDDIIQGLEENVIYLNSSIFVAGEDGRGIESIVKTSTSGLVDTYTITYTDATTSTFNVTNGAQGAQGADGVGITSIAKTSTSGLVDTYTITMSNGTTTTFDVTNGMDGVDLGLANIVNDLTTGGATNVLSAEMGRVLGDRVSILEGNIPPLPAGDELQGYINVASPYEYKASTTDICAIVDISAYAGMKMTISAVNGDIGVSILQNNNLVLRQTPTFSTTYNTPIVIRDGNSYVFILTNDCKYLVYLKSVRGATRMPNITIENIGTATPDTDVHIKMRIGALALADGKPYVGYNETRIAEIKQQMLSDVYLELPYGASVFSVSGVESGETLGYACYDADFALLGFNAIPISGSRYVRPYLKKSTAYTHNDKELIFTIRNTSLARASLKCLGEELATNDITWFSYPLHNITIGNDTASSSTYEGDNGLVTTTVGYVILPPNYTKDGKKSPVVVHCHGTGGVYWQKASMPTLAYNLDYLKFIAKNGYVVIGCCTTTELYAQQYRDADIATPLTYSAYLSLINYIADCYNIDTDHISIFGYSAGGVMSNMLARLRPVNFRCVASLAGSLDYVTNGRVVSPMYGDANILGNQLLGIPTTNQPSYFSSGGQNAPIDTFMIERFKEYKANICGFSPLFFGLTGVEIDDMMDELYSTRCASTNLDSNTNLQNLIALGKIVCNTPTKIWHAIDDANVPYAISKYYVEMIHRAGGYARLRTFPTGCGQHNAVGNSTNTTNVPFMNYLTKFGETINVPVCYGELVDWFNKWND